MGMRASDFVVLTKNSYGKELKEQKMGKVLADDQNQSNAEAVIKQDTGLNEEEWGSMKVPLKLMPVVEKLIHAFLKASAFN